MKLGISTYAFTWAVGVPGRSPANPMSAEDLLDRAAGLGVRVVQIADNLPLDRLTSARLNQLAAHASRLGIQIEVGTRGIGADRLRAYLDLAVFFQSPILRVVLDTATHRPPEDETVETLRAAMPAFERADVCLAIENHDRFPARTLARIVDRIDSPSVGICLDTVNSLGALEGPDHVLEVLGPRVVNLHLKDFMIRRADHAMGFTVDGRPAGAGMLDIPHLLARLNELGRDPNAILELWTPPQETLEETIALESAWAEESVRYLSRFIQ